MLTAHNLECVRGERRLFTALEFAVKPGTLLAVRGVNGSGKTSLLRMMCGLLAPAAGKLRWKDSDINEAGEEYRASLLYLGHLNGLKDELNAVENLRLSMHMAGIDCDDAQAVTALEWSGLRERRHQACGTLSQGQRRRVARADLAKHLSSCARAARGCRCGLSDRACDREHWLAALVGRAGKLIALGALKVGRRQA
mgnify:CR=1 FL=1